MLSKDEALQKIEDLKRYIDRIPEINSIFSSLVSVGISREDLTLNTDGSVELTCHGYQWNFDSAQFGTNVNFALRSDGTLVIKKV